MQREAGAISREVWVRGFRCKGHAPITVYVDEEGHGIGPLLNAAHSAERWWPFGGESFHSSAFHLTSKRRDDATKAALSYTSNVGAQHAT
jgi:hypothetical protein